MDTSRICPVCQNSSEGDQQFCRNCGAESVHHDETTEQIIKLKLPDEKREPRMILTVSRIHRIAAAGIDLWIIFFIINLVRVGIIPMGRYLFPMFPLNLRLSLCFSLCLILREIYSPGKHAMGLMVTELKNGEFASLPRRLIRDVTLIAPLIITALQDRYPLSYLLAFLFEFLVVLSDRRGRRLGDLFAGTVVERRRNVPQMYAWIVFAVSGIILILS
ncbi:MAG: RDD family protein [bacterium]|nr:RDD family protein [bacterium]